MTTRGQDADAIDWNEVYGSNEARLRRVIARRINAAQVDDVLQETFLRAFQGRHLFDRNRPIAPWLNGIAVRAAADAWARSGGRDTGDAPVAEAKAERSAEDEYEARQQRLVIGASLAALTARHRLLLHEVAVEGRAQSALARAEGVHPDTVRAAVTRARRQFQATYVRLSAGAGVVAS